MKVKRIILSALLACLLVAAAFPLSACNPLPNNSEGVSVTLIVLDLDSQKLYEKELFTRKSSLYEALNEFEGLQVQVTSSFSGAFVNAVMIGTVEENEYGPYFKETSRIEGSLAESTYIAVYHDIDDDSLKDLSAFAVNLEYGGKEYFYSGVGVSLLPLNEGATYILKLASY